jgi:hypothetical protein
MRAKFRTTSSIWVGSTKAGQRCRAKLVLRCTVPPKVKAEQIAHPLDLSAEIDRLRLEPLLRDGQELCNELCAPFSSGADQLDAFPTKWVNRYRVNRYRNGFVRGTSALPLIATASQARRHVANVPEAELGAGPPLPCFDLNPALPLLEFTAQSWSCLRMTIRCWRSCRRP